MRNKYAYYTKDKVCMTIYSELSIDGKPMKNTKMSCHLQAKSHND